MIFKGYFFSAAASVGASATQRSPQETRAPLDIELGGDAMEYYYLIILILIVATGYILSIKK